MCLSLVCLRFLWSKCCFVGYIVTISIHSERLGMLCYLWTKVVSDFKSLWLTLVWVLRLARLSIVLCYMPVLVAIVVLAFGYVSLRLWGLLHSP